MHPPQVARARRREYCIRAARAQRNAYSALARLYPKDWERLYRRERQRVENECGPLPGDKDDE